MFPDFTTLAGAAFIVGAFAIVFGVIILGLGWKFTQVRWGGVVVGAVGVILLFSGLTVNAYLPAATGGSNTPIVSGAAVNSYLVTTKLVTGETFNAQTNVLTVDVEYNRTAACWAVQATNATTDPSGNHLGCSGGGTSTDGYSYVAVAIHSARTDVQNQTAGINYGLSGIPTYNSLGNNPTTYSFVGYSAATEQANGQWQVHWSLGSTGGQIPLTNAPSVTTNVASTTLGISAFGSNQPYIWEVLGGSNSTSAPYSSFTALTTFSSYSGETISISQSTPASIGITYLVLGSCA